MFSQTNYIEQDSAKHHLTLVKANRVSKYCTRSLCKLFAIYNKSKGSSKHYPFIIVSSKNGSVNLKLPKCQR